MVVFSTKLHVTGVWLVIVTLFSSHERETLTDPAAHRQTAVTSVPLRLFIESPQLQVQLQLSSFLMSFLHRRQPRAGGVKRRFDHLELLQARFMNVLLLHDVQLWEKQTMLT